MCIIGFPEEDQNDIDRILLNMFQLKTCASQLFLVMSLSDLSAILWTHKVCKACIYQVADLNLLAE